MNELEKNILLIETLQLLENPNVTEELLLGQAEHINDLMEQEEIDQYFIDTLYGAMLRNEPTNNYIIMANALNNITEDEKDRLELRVLLRNVRISNNEQQSINFINAVIAKLQTKNYYDSEIINPTILLCYSAKRFDLLNNLYEALKDIKNDNLEIENNM